MVGPESGRGQTRGWRQPGRNWLEQVRSSCQWVAERAVHVRIHQERIASYAQSLPLEQLARPQHDAASHYLGRGDDTVAFFVTLDSINFGSGYFPHLRKRPGMSGYFTVASSLRDHFEEHGPFRAQKLMQLTRADCTQIFGQDLDNEPIGVLMELFARALNDLGRYLLDRFAGSSVALVNEAARSAERLVELLAEMPYFRDVALYNGRQVPFLKRAQLTAADLAVAFDGQGPGRFDDLHCLTMFADNLVPHVLRMDGVLRYDDELARQISQQELLEAGSQSEVEIRACAVHAVELLVAELSTSGHEVTAAQLDYLLWNRGQHPHYKARPRHRTRTVYY